MKDGNWRLGGFTFRQKGALGKVFSRVGISLDVFILIMNRAVFWQRSSKSVPISLTKDYFINSLFSSPQGDIVRRLESAVFGQKLIL